MVNLSERISVSDRRKKNMAVAYSGFTVMHRPRMLQGPNFQYEQQKNLTDKLILSPKNSLEIIKSLTAIRLRVDDHLLKKWERDGKRRPENYPEGHCKEISVEMLNVLDDELDRPSNPVGLKILKEFIDSGGVLKRIWTIESGKYFQNSLQCGTCIIDVANNSIDPAKKPVDIEPDINSGRFQNISSIKQFADVAETYWECEIFPNYIFSLIAPLFPVVMVRQVTINKTDNTTENYRELTLVPSISIVDAVTHGPDRGKNPVFEEINEFLKTDYGKKYIPRDLENQFCKSELGKHIGAMEVAYTPTNLVKNFRAISLRVAALQRIFVTDRPEFIRQFSNMAEIGRKLSDRSLALIKEEIEEIEIGTVTIKT